MPAIFGTTPDNHRELGEDHARPREKSRPDHSRRPRHRHNAPGPGDPDKQVETETVVDDYADSLLAPSELGRTWAPTRRWAIALGDGRLVFATDNDITPSRLPQSGRFGPPP